MKKIAIALMLSTVAVAPAFAEQMYVGVNLGQNKYDFAGAGITGTTKDTSTAFGILGGYSFNKNIAVEVAYTSLGSVDVVPGVTVKGSAMSVSGVGSYPFNDQFSLFAKLGIAQTKIESTGSASETKSGATFGIGGQYNVSSTIGIRVGYDRYKVGKNPSIDTSVMSVGGVFGF